MKVYTIYKATNKVNGKSYIGFDSNWPSRPRGHKHNALHGKDYALSHAIRKHGWDSFEWHPLYQSTCRTHTLDTMEEYFIREYKTHVDDNGYNMTLGGEGNAGFTDEVKWKMGSCNRGKKRGPMSAERRQAISDAKKGVSTITEEQRELLRRINTGKKHPESAIRKKSKDYIATSPDGTVYEFFNLNAFCKEHGLHQGAMSAVARGIKTHYKRWTVRFTDESKAND